jgi:hypothetical protein
MNLPKECWAKGEVIGPSLREHQLISLSLSLKKKYHYCSSLHLSKHYPWDQWPSAIQAEWQGFSPCRSTLCRKSLWLFLSTLPKDRNMRNSGKSEGFSSFLVSRKLTCEMTLLFKSLWVQVEIIQQVVPGPCLGFFWVAHDFAVHKWQSSCPLVPSPLL